MTANVGLSIDANVVERFPDVTVACIGVTLSSLADDVVDATPPSGVTIENLVSHDTVAAWRYATKNAGLKPSTYKSSVEQLTRRVLKEGAIRTGLPVVDLYCGVSVRHMAPLGAYDPTRLPTPHIALRCAMPDDRFNPIGSGSFPLTDTVVVYAAGTTVCCYSWNHRDSADTCLTPRSDTAIFVGEAVTLGQRDALRSAIEEIRLRFGRASDITELSATNTTGNVSVPTAE